MKIWTGYGTEHSENLVMIGHFKESGAAEAAHDAIERLKAFFVHEHNRPDKSRWNEKTVELLRSLKFLNVSAADLEIFAFDVQSEVKGQKVVIHTDETDVGGIVRLLLERGARIEMYSAHVHPEQKDE